MNGSRSAATSGGRSAFRTAITAAAASAPQKAVTCAPGRSQAAMSSAIVTRSHRDTSWPNPSFGRWGLHVGCSP